MKKLPDKITREVFRRVIRERKSPSYLQQILLQSDQSTIEPLEKYFDQHDMAHSAFQNPQHEFDNNEFKIKQEEKVINDNDYFLEFEQNITNLKASLKVEREKLNLQYSQYQKIISKSKEISELYMKSIKMLGSQLNQRYKESQDMLSLSHKANSIQQIRKMRVQRQQIKKQQVILENQIQETLSRIILEMDSRTTFHKKLLKNGYYQANGLLWVFEKAQEILQFDLQCRQKIIQIFSNKMVQNMSLPKEISLQDMPEILDHKSKQYLFDCFMEIKQERRKSSEFTQSRKKKMKQNQPNYSISIPLHQNHTGSASRMISKSAIKYRQKQSLGSKDFFKSENEHIMYAKTNDNIIRRYKIVDSSNLRLHTGSSKYNYDIKNIYANTRQALAKWVKLKCELADQNTEQPSSKALDLKQYKITEQNQFVRSNNNQNQFYSQNLLKDESTKFEKFLQQPFRSQMKKSDSRIRRNQRSQHVKSLGLSLPFIEEKKVKSSKYKTSSHQRHTVINKRENKTSQDKADRSTSITVQMGKLAQEREQLRIMRIYDQNKQQKVIKYLFGILVKKENIGKSGI